MEDSLVLALVNQGLLQFYPRLESFVTFSNLEHYFTFPALLCNLSIFWLFRKHFSTFFTIFHMLKKYISVVFGTFSVKASTSVIMNYE